MKTLLMVVGLPIAAVIGIVLLAASWPLALALACVFYFGDDILVSVSCLAIGIVIQFGWQSLWVKWVFD